MSFILCFRWNNVNKIIILVKRIIFSTFLIYGYNMIAVNFQLVVPINAITISLVTFLGAPGLLALVLFKLIIMWGIYGRYF